VANGRSNTVSVINTATNTVSATIPVGEWPWEVAVTPDGSKAYVTNGNINTVSVINTATNTVSATITIGNIPSGAGNLGVSVTPDGSKVYVVSGVGTVSVISTATDNIIATIPVGFSPSSFGNFISPYIQPNGITSLINKPYNISVYPNPSNNKITIDTEEEAEIEISIIEGKIIKRLKTKDNKTDIDISDFASGIYIIRAQTDKGIMTKKFIKE